MDPGITKRQFVTLLGSSCLGALAVRPQDPATRPAAAPGFPRTIVLVRHAERAAEPKEDPGLTAAGEERARRLAALLAASRVTHLFATEFARTQRTLQPLADLASLEVRQVRGTAPGELLRALAGLPRGAVAVVAGHSNTVPGLLAKLTAGAAVVTIGEDQHDRLFVITQWGEAASALALELRY